MNGPDRLAVQRSFRRAASRFAAADFLHGEIRERLLERFELVRLEPEIAVDLGAGPGLGASAMALRFPDARIMAVDLAADMLRPAARESQRLTAVQPLCGDAAALPLNDGSVDLVFSNLLLHWCADPGRVLQEVRRVLRHPGLFSFSTFGPATLGELRAAWLQADSFSHVLVFPEMHNLGDALVAAGFAEPVLDTEYLTVTYPDVRRLAEDLRAVGATNLTVGRSRGLTSRSTWARMVAAYEQFRDADGRIPAVIEVIYGHAWVAPDRPQQRSTAAGEIEVPLGNLTRRGKLDR